MHRTAVPLIVYWPAVQHFMYWVALPLFIFSDHTIQSFWKLAHIIIIVDIIIVDIIIVDIIIVDIIKMSPFLDLSPELLMYGWKPYQDRWNRSV